MTYTSSTDASFLSTVGAWIEATGEVLILIRHHAAAGSRDFEFYDSNEAFRERLAGLPSRTCVIVFREKQLPCRGTVDPAFVSAALAAVPDGTEWLAVSLQQTVAGRVSWFHHASGATHIELREELEGCLGTRVAVGPHPPWLQDNEKVLSAIVPDENGVVVVGVY